MIYNVLYMMFFKIRDLIVKANHILLHALNFLLIAILKHFKFTNIFFGHFIFRVAGPIQTQSRKILSDHKYKYVYSPFKFIILTREFVEVYHF